MRVSRRNKALLIAATAASLIGGVAPASADCVYAEASYSTLGGPTQYVVGPKKCIVSTPWGYATGGGVPAGNDLVRVNAHLWLPSPVVRETGEDPQGG
jgi:hypothetical protein